MTSQKFEYSYQECLGCENCKEIVNNTPNRLKSHCTRFLDLNLNKRVKYTIPCGQYKPKQENKMTENKMETTEWDTLTPGKLIGKEVSLDGCKCVVIGDKRLLPQIKDEACFIVAKPLNPTSWSVKYCVKPDEISPWIEPEVLEERAQFLVYNTNTGLSFVPENAYTEKEARRRYFDKINCVKWPVGQIYKFNMNGELVE